MKVFTPSLCALLLSVSSSWAAIGSVSGSVLNGATHAPFPAGTGISPGIELILCPTGDCANIFFRETKGFILFADGERDFTFTAATNNGVPQPAGRYLVHAWIGIAGYSAAEQIVDVADGEHVTVGTLLLFPPLVLFENVTSCDGVPTTGGKCPFSYDMVNVGTTTLQVLTWQMVTVFDHGSRFGLAIYQAKGEQGPLSLAPGGRITITNHIGFPAFAQDGAVACVDAWVALYRVQAKHFDTQNMEQLFCALKGDAFLAPDQPS